MDSPFEATPIADQNRRFENALFDNVSHELKTPLTVILATLEQAEPNLAEIREAARRLHRTIDNLLTVAQLEADEMKPTSEWCDPGEIAREAVERSSLNKGAILVNIPPDLPFIFVDPDFVERALGILLANAIAHSAANDHVELTVRCEGDVIVWSVLDRGPGVTAEVGISVFAKFHLGAGQLAGGLGLGLFIAKKLADMVGGSLFASNRQDGGASFALSVPIGMPTTLSGDVGR